MFSGIVETVGSVVGVQDRPLERRVTLRTPRGWKLGDGESVAIEGVCSTVQDRTSRSFTVVYMQETLRRTTLGALAAGRPVNLERSLRLNGLVGGHLVQGHVDTTAEIVRITPSGDARIYEFGLPVRYRRYLVEKGSIAIDGISLTVASKTARGCTVSLLAYTLGHTTLGTKRRGDRVNVETDLVAKYVEQLLPR